MNVNEYQTMRDVEDNHWWYLGFRRIYSSMIDRFCRKSASGRVLDAGCGTGAFLDFLSERYRPTRLAGLDFSGEALTFCEERGFSDLVQASVVELPLEDRSFDMVSSLDVLCHRSIPDDLVPLREFSRVLIPGGFLLLNLPAFPFIYSEHDVAVHTLRRYRRPEVARKLMCAGFEPVHVTYTNSFLFPLVAGDRLARNLLKGRPDEAQAKSDLGKVREPLNTALAWILGSERHLACRVSLPFGSSVTAVARKK